MPTKKKKLISGPLVITPTGTEGNRYSVTLKGERIGTVTQRVQDGLYVNGTVLAASGEPKTYATVEEAAEALT